MALSAAARRGSDFGLNPKKYGSKRSKGRKSRKPGRK